MKFRTQFTEEPVYYENLSPRSLTIPDQALTIPQIIQRAQNGSLAMYHIEHPDTGDGDADLDDGIPVLDESVDTLDLMSMSAEAKKTIEKHKRRSRKQADTDPAPAPQALDSDA